MAFRTPPGILDGASPRRRQPRLDALVGTLARALGRTVLETPAARPGRRRRARLAGTAGPPESSTSSSLDKILFATLSRCQEKTAGRWSFSRDLTEEKRLESVRRDFIANASRARTPVAAITGRRDACSRRPRCLDPSRAGFSR